RERIARRSERQDPHGWRDSNRLEPLRPGSHAPRESSVRAVEPSLLLQMRRVDAGPFFSDLLFLEELRQHDIPVLHHPDFDRYGTGVHDAPDIAATPAERPEHARFWLSVVRRHIC